MRDAAIASGPLDGDLDILTCAPTRELLGADAYKTALGLNVPTRRAPGYFGRFAMHEQRHVGAVTAAIRRSAAPR